MTKTTFMKTALNYIRNSRSAQHLHTNYWLSNRCVNNTVTHSRLFSYSCVYVFVFLLWWQLRQVNRCISGLLWQVWGFLHSYHGEVDMTGRFDPSLSSLSTRGHNRHSKISYAPQSITFIIRVNYKTAVKVDGDVHIFSMLKYFLLAQHNTQRQL